MTRTVPSLDGRSAFFTTLFSYADWYARHNAIQNTTEQTESHMIPPQLSLINHVVFVLDASDSMRRHTENLIKATDAQIKHLAQRSKEMQQQTRISIYTFNYDVQCLISDTDVHALLEHMPSIRGLYTTTGMTALTKATHLAIDDLKMAFEKYGNHSYLLYVLTDGEENYSGWDSVQSLPGKITALPENWTLGCLVPDVRGIHQAKQFGFPAGNIAMWDANSTGGVEEAAKTIQAATDAYMVSRSQGLRGTRSLFQVDIDKIDTAAVKSAGLKPLDSNKYVLSPVTTGCTTSEFVAKYREMHPDHSIGDVFYQLTGSKATKGKKGIIVQGYKPVAVMERNSGKIYVGSEARKLVGLPDHNVTVDPADTKGDYLLFVRSDAPNRILYVGTKFLMMKK